MGRKRLNRPKETLIAERRARQLKYYYHHKAKISEKRMKRYYENKNLHKM
jgi:hypothetical protein